MFSHFLVIINPRGVCLSYLSTNHRKLLHTYNGRITHRQQTIRFGMRVKNEDLNVSKVVLVFPGAVFLELIKCLYSRVFTSNENKRQKSKRVEDWLS